VLHVFVIGTIYDCLYNNVGKEIVFVGERSGVC